MRETPRAAAAFLEYCTLGPSRSLAKLAKVVVGDATVHIRQLEKWSSEFGWVERAKLFDAERAEEKRIKKQADIDAMDARHAQIGITQQAKAIKQIDALINAQKFGSQATVQLLKIAVDLERVARGEPTSIDQLTSKDGGPIQVQRNTDLAALDEDELDAVEAILRKAQERIHGSS